MSGNPRLNLAFVANLFNTHPCLEPLEPSQVIETEGVEDFDAEGEREARVFTLWLNSLNVEPGVFNLFENLKVRCPFCYVRRSLLTCFVIFQGWNNHSSSFRQAYSRLCGMA